VRRGDRQGAGQLTTVAIWMLTLSFAPRSRASSIIARQPFSGVLAAMVATISLSVIRVCIPSLHCSSTSPAWIGIASTSIPTISSRPRERVSWLRRG